MSSKEPVCPECSGQVCECYARIGGDTYYKVLVCIDCGWVKKYQVDRWDVSTHGRK